MPVTIASLSTTPYAVIAVAPNSIPDPGPGAAAPAAGTPIKFRNEHTMYPTNAGRIKVVVKPPVLQSNIASARATVTGTPDPNNGDGYNLPFFQKEITSIRLPAPPHQPPIDVFFTDNMSGCKFFVDAIQGSNDLIVFHANTLADSTVSAAYADFQSPTATAALDQLHNDAVADYARHINLRLTAVGTCSKPTYYKEPANEERRKSLHGRFYVAQGGLRRPPQFLGGCSIFGFPKGNTWQFWYQTNGDVEYERPIGKLDAVTGFHFQTLKKLRDEGQKHSASLAVVNVYDHGLIC